MLRTYEKLEPVKSTEGSAHQAIDTLESLVRLNPKFPLEEATLARLRILAMDESRREAGPRAAAFRVLIGRGLDADMEVAALHSSDAEILRLATQVLAGSGGGLDQEHLVGEIQDALKNGNRYLALRAYIRHAAKMPGCGPIVDVIDDPDKSVALGAIDALGDLCKDDEEITKRLEGEVRVPPVQGSWSRETHALVALAKRAPERAAAFMNGFVTHQSFWVRDVYRAAPRWRPATFRGLERLATIPTTTSAKRRSRRYWR